MSHLSTGSRNHRGIDCCRWLVLLLACGVSLCALAQDTATFQFNPPDGYTYIEKEHTTHTEEYAMGDKVARSTSTEETSTKNVIHKTATGYTVTATLTDVTETRDGNPEDVEPYYQAMLNVPIVTSVDANGKFLSVSGVDTAVANFKKLLAPEDLGALGYIATEKGLTEQIKSLWYESQQSLVGRTVKTDDSWTMTNNEPMPNGKSVKTTSSIRMVGLEMNNGHEGVRLRYTKQYDAKAMSAGVAYVMQQMMRAAGNDEKINVSVKSQTEEGDDVIDPVTLQPLAGSSTTTSVTVLTSSDNTTVTITKRDVDDTTIEYNPGAFTRLPAEVPAG